MRRVIYLDSGILIAAHRSARPEVRDRALPLLGSHDCTLVASLLVQAETIPKATYHGRDAELVLYQRVFERVAVWVKVDEGLLREGYALAQRHGLSAMDAFHGAAALRAAADEMATSERLESPLFRLAAEGLRVTSIL